MGLLNNIKNNTKLIIVRAKRDRTNILIESLKRQVKRYNDEIQRLEK